MLSNAHFLQNFVLIPPRTSPPKFAQNLQNYSDCDCPIKIVLRHIWVGKDGAIKRSLLLHAADGLSSFLVMDLHEDGVAKTCGVHESMTREQSQSTTTLSLLRVTHLLSLFQLLWHLAVTRNIWLVVDDEATWLPRASLVGGVPPSIRKFAALVYASSISFQMMATAIPFFVTTDIRARRLLPFLSYATIASFVIPACGDVTQVQLPVLHGLVLLFCYEVIGARIVLYGTWMRSGMHKINPNFLLSPSAEIDPVFASVLQFEPYFSIQESKHTSAISTTSFANKNPFARP